MTNEGLLHIHLEWDQELEVFNYDGVPAVTLELHNTILFNKMADAIRVANGHRPCFFESEDMDAEGYYRFFVTLVGKWPGCKPYIEFTYVGEYGKETDSDKYRFLLTDAQRLAVFTAVNALCDELWDETAVCMMAKDADAIGLHWKGMMYGDL